VFKGLTQYLYR